MKIKHKWNVSDEPTGRYRSFEKRMWPMARYENGEVAAAIYCLDSYIPVDAKTGRHDELTVTIADHSVSPWRWRTLKARFATLDEAKKAVKDFIEKYPHYAPKETT